MPQVFGLCDQIEFTKYSSPLCCRRGKTFLQRSRLSSQSWSFWSSQNVFGHQQNRSNWGKRMPKVSKKPRIVIPNSKTKIIIIPILYQGVEVLFLKLKKFVSKMFFITKNVWLALNVHGPWILCQYLWLQMEIFIARWDFY